jgi:succinate dehydrogenase / fumarate reductase flavoprotein subunit
MKIFPAVHYSMGGLWVDYERTVAGGLKFGSPKNQVTSIPGLYALGECDYQYHGANRLGANSLLSCIFSGFVIAPGVQNLLKSLSGKSAADQPSSLYETARAREQREHDRLLKRSGGGENPYLLHQELGQIMTKASTVVRHNNVLREAYGQVSELAVKAERCSLSDTGTWTNQNVVFTKALRDMFPLAKAILKGALQRDECRGAHYKPEFALPGLTATSPAEHRREAEIWCDRFEANTKKWLKSTIATLKDGEPELTYDDVDTSLIPPRPRLYGLVGAEMIEEVWKQRQAGKSQPASDGNGATSKSPVAAAAS